MARAKVRGTVNEPVLALRARVDPGNDRMGFELKKTNTFSGCLVMGLRDISVA